MIKTGRYLYEFGPFRLDPSERLLLRDDKPVAVTARPFDALVVLLERAGRLVSKADLMSTVWPNCFIEESNVAVTISTLRKALADDGPEYVYIQTVAGRGYRFTGEVRRIPQTAPEEATPPSEPIPVITAPAGKEGPAQSAPARRSRVNRPIWILAATVMIVAVSVLLKLRLGSAVSEQPIRSLVVLPFRGLNLDPARDYLRVGMADAIITKLAATGQVVIRPTTSALDDARVLANPIAIGREQKVDAVVSGSIEVSVERVRVHVQLMKVVDGSLVWAGSFEGTEARLFDLEQQVEDKIAQAIAVHAPGQEKMRTSGMTTQNPEAYRLYLEGRYFWNKRTEQGLRRSIESFQRATLEDERYAAAYAGLADSYALLASYGVEPTQQAYPMARAAAQKALQLDDGLPEAHTSLGMISFYCEWNWREAEREFRRSIELNPNYALAHTWYALELAALGRSGEALSQIQTAYQLDPLSMSTNTEVGRVFYWNRQYERAIEAFHKTINLDPNFARAHTRLGMAYAAKRDFAAALEEFAQARELSGPDPYLDGLTGYAQALSGNGKAAQKMLAELTVRAGHEFVPAFSMALVCVGLGDRNGAIDWLSRAYRDRSTYMVYANADPLLDPIRSDPRFGELMRQMGLIPGPREPTEPIR